ncbi:MAG: tetratricopeptide repeat protein, partial [Candidatus Marinimicrobia bacterium]|nr:tetratricopeptide repeat protein [Candidatus Neomarinimicrobiota bacterium]
RQFPADARVLEARRRLELLRSPTPPDAESAPASAAAEPAPPAGGDTLSREAMQAYNRGARHQAAGEWAAAAEAYLEALATAPRFPLTWFNLGSVHQAQLDLEAAIEAYDRALELDPTLTAARYNLALCLYEKEAYPAARAAAEALVAANPQSAEAHYLLGLILLKPPADIPAAARHYGTFLRLAPLDPNAQLVRRWLRDNGYDW